MNKMYTNFRQYAVPTDPKDLVNKEYVDAAVNKKLKDPVHVVVTTNLDTTTGTGVYVYDATEQTITQVTGAEFVFDGVTMAENDRILVAGQTDPKENGIYVVTTLGASGTPGVLTRASDFDKNVTVPANTIIPVMKGSQADTNWQVIDDTAVVPGTNAIHFARFKGSDGAKSYSTTFTGDGTAKEWTINHNLDTTNVHVAVYDGDGECCLFGVKIIDENSIKVSSDVTLTAADTFSVTVLG